VRRRDTEFGAVTSLPCPGAVR